MAIGTQKAQIMLFIVVPVTIQMIYFKDQALTQPCSSVLTALANVLTTSEYTCSCRESNPDDLSITRLSTAPVYLFQHRNQLFLKACLPV